METLTMLKPQTAPDDATPFERWLFENRYDVNDVAETLGYNRQYVRQVMRGKEPNPRFIGRFAQVFGADLMRDLFLAQPQDTAA